MSSSSSSSSSCSFGRLRFADANQWVAKNVKNHTLNYNPGGIVDKITVTWEANVSDCCSNHRWKTAVRTYTYTYTLQDTEEVLIATSGDILPIDLAAYTELYPTLVSLVTQWFTDQIFDTVYAVSQDDKTTYDKVLKYIMDQLKPTLPTQGAWKAGAGPC